MAKVEDKFENVDFNLFEAITAIDKKDYGYYDKLTVEQQKKFIPYMLIIWTSCIKSSSNLQGYYLLSTEYHANKYLFNDYIQKNPKLQWLMLCSASPCMGKQIHQYLPQLSVNISRLRELAKQKDVEEYFKKIYPKGNLNDIHELSKMFVSEQHKKTYLANKFPNLKYEDIQTLSTIITQEEINQYEYDSGNENKL